MLHRIVSTLLHYMTKYKTRKVYCNITVKQKDVPEILLKLWTFNKRV